MEAKKIKLTKYQLNELLYRVSKDNKTYGLVMKLAYIYAKKITEVGNLQRKDIDFTNNKITFHISSINHKPIDYPIHKSLINDLKIITEDKNNEEYIFDEYYPHEKTRKVINNYLITCSKKEGLDFLKTKGMVSQDFRVLRGQHLLQDGVKLEVLQKLYAHTKIISTMSLIDYDSLIHEKEITLDTVFNDYTDLNIFCEWDYYNYNNYYCTFKDNDALIEVDNGKVEIIGDKIIRDKLNSQSNLLDDLSSLTQAGDYCFINNIKVLKQ